MLTNQGTCSNASVIGKGDHVVFARHRITSPAELFVLPINASEPSVVSIPKQVTFFNEVSRTNV
jgi:hypothetical protein